MSQVLPIVAASVAHITATPCLVHMADAEKTRRQLMPKTVGDSRDVAVSGARPEAAMRQIADKLTAHGFDIRFLDPEGRYLEVINLPGTTCEIMVNDCGAVTWDYWRQASRGADPGRVIALALRLLTEGSVDYPPTSPPCTAGCSFHGIVGRELEAKGLDVSLEVYADQVSFEAWGEIVATNPTRPERGRVRVGDEPGLVWQSGCCRAALPDFEAIADTIITVLTRDVADGYIQRDQPQLVAGGRGPA